MAKKKGIKTIRAKGVQILLVSIQTLFMFAFEITAIVLIALDSNFSNFYIIIAALAAAYTLYLFFKLAIFSSKIIFDEEGNFITYSNNTYLKPIKTSCKDFISYEIKAPKYCMVLLLQNSRTNEKYSISNFTFTKKQIKKILREIKERGGLPDQEIDLTIRQTKEPPK